MYIYIYIYICIYALISNQFLFRNVRYVGEIVFLLLL